ncbi:MAG: DUF4401 domain-containing protein [Betaproteobacteria bacterium]|nr:MAG: DUF4401 domain-containing protein [Betaproteobacteria bacterium]
MGIGCVGCGLHHRSGGLFTQHHSQKNTGASRRKISKRSFRRRSATMNIATLWQRLSNELLVTGDAPTVPEREAPVPWIGRIMMAVLGWFAGIMLLGTTGALFFVVLFGEGRAGAAVVGILLLVAAWWMFRVPQRNEFFQQLAFSMSIAGQLAAAWALTVIDSFGGIALALMILQIGLIAVMANRQHRFVSTLFAWAAFAVFLAERNVASALPAVIALTTVLLWRSETRWICAGHDDWLRPVAHGTWLSLLITCAVGLNSDVTKTFNLSVWQASSALAAIWIFAVFLYTDRLAAIKRVAVMIAALLLAAACWKAPGLLAAAIGLLVAFARGSRTGTALALLATVLYLSAHYYQTNTTLLEKSYSLAILALGLWIGAALLHFFHKPSDVKTSDGGVQ